MILLRLLRVFWVSCTYIWVLKSNIHLCKSEIASYSFHRDCIKAVGQFGDHCHTSNNKSTISHPRDVLLFVSVQSLSRVWPCNPMNHSTPGLLVHYQLPEFTQTHVHRAGDAIQPSHPLSSPSPLAPNPSQHQSLFQWVNSLHEVAKVLEFQLQHQSFQWAPRTDLL